MSDLFPDFSYHIQDYLFNIDNSSLSIDANDGGDFFPSDFTALITHSGELYIVDDTNEITEDSIVAHFSAQDSQWWKLEVINSECVYKGKNSKVFLSQ